MLRSITGMAAGLATGILIVLTAGFAARTLWPAYAIAEPHKAFTLAMLASRLTAGAFAASLSACVATLIARDSGKAAWWLGALFLAISIPIHIREWADFPVWYHFVYLGYLVPVAGLTGQALAHRPSK